MDNPLVMSVVHKASYLFGPSFSKEMRPHAERHSENLSRLRSASESGNRRKTREAQDRVLKSFSSRLVSLVRSLDKKPSLTRDWIRETAASLDPYRDCGEPVILRAEPKGQGLRAVCAFGPKRSALHRLCADIITARFDCEPTDYLRKGRGADVASDQINNLVEEGYEYFVLVDVKDSIGPCSMGVCERH
jgi:hypothetical protein